MKEIWRDIVGYEKFYKVSSVGRVKSMRTNKIRILQLHKHGHYDVGFTLNYSRKLYKAHRLVAIAFIPNPENKPDINHKNGIRTDNRICNLEWVTVAENNKHARETGLFKSTIGMTRSRGKLKRAEVIKIRKMRGKYTIDFIARKFGIHKATVLRTCSGKSWANVHENLELEDDNQLFV